MDGLMDEEPRDDEPKRRRQSAKAVVDKPPGLGPDDVPNRRRYPALGMAHRTVVPKDERQRAEDVAAFEEQGR
jgi:hypothetical protein